MAGRIKGITLEIGGDTTPLTKALKAANVEAKKTQDELENINRLLKLDPKNTDLLKQKQENLNKQLDITKNNLETLKTAKKKLDVDMKNGTEVNAEEYRRLQRNIAQTEADIKRLTLETNKFTQAGEKIQNVGNKMTDIGKKGAIASAAITAAGFMAVEAASDLEESTNKVDVAFGDSSEKIKKWAETTLDGYGIAKGTALDMAALYGDMGTAMGIPRDAAADMSAAIVGLAGDLASFKNISLDTAQNALKGIFTGETESLKNLGVIMNETTLSEYALASGIQKKYKEMTQSEKVALRYNYVMAQTANAQGDFARTSDGYANSSRVMTESIKEMSASFGEMLLPIITPIIQAFTNLIKWIAGLNTGTKAVIVTIAAIIAIIPPLLIVIGQCTVGVGALIKAYAKLTVAIEASTAAQTTLSAVMSVMPYVAVVAGIAAVTMALLGHRNALEKLQDAHEKEIKAIDDQMKSEMAEAEKVKMLENRLYELEEQINSGTLSEKEATSAKEEFASVSNSLNDIIPGIIDNIGTETSAYAIQRGEVSALTQSYYDLAYAKAMANAYQAKIEATAKSLLEVKEKQKQYAPTGEATISAGTGTKTTAYEKYQANKALQASKALTAEQKRLEKEMSGYISEMAQYQTKITQTETNKQVGAVSAGNAKKVASTKSAGKASSSAVEKAMEKELRDIKYAHEMGEISDADYYKKLEEYRNKYFNVGSKEWQSYTVEIHNYLDGLKKGVQSTYDEMAQNAITRTDEILEAQKSLASKLKDYGTLYTVKTDTFVGLGEHGADVTRSYVELTDLSGAISKLNDYRDTLNAIRDRGVPQGFFEILRGLSIEDGIMFGKELLATSDMDFNTYLTRWSEYQSLSEEISKDLYSSEIMTLQGEIADEFSEMSDDFKAYGIDSADEWCNGFMEKLEALREKIRSAMSSLVSKDTFGSVSGVGSSSTTNNSTTNYNMSITNNGSTPSAYEQRTQFKRMLNTLALEARA